MDAPQTKTGLRIAGAGAAACVACCAGPILGFLAAAGIASLLGAVVFGIVGVLVVLAVVAVLWQRRRRATTCRTDTEPVPVELSTRAPSEP